MPVENWSCVASSADGSKLIAGAGVFWSRLAGPVYTSADSGATWTATSLPVSYWRGVASSSDGSKLVAVPYGGVSHTNLPIYTSTDSGATWTTNSLMSESWSCVASSADGMKLAVGGDSGPIYTSTNSGLTWISNNVPIEYYQFIASSADGNALVAVTDYNITSTGTGPIYSSTNSGTTWVSNNVVGSDIFWQTAAVSTDGAKWVAAGVYAYGSPFGNIYITPPEVLLESEVVNGNFIVSWPTNAWGFSLEQSPILPATNWVAVTNSASITNGNNQVVLPATKGLFLRLKQ